MRTKDPDGWFNYFLARAAGHYIVNVCIILSSDFLFYPISDADLEIEMQGSTMKVY